MWMWWNFKLYPHYYWKVVSRVLHINAVHWLLMTWRASSYIAARTKTVISSPGMASSSSNISEEPYKMQIVEMKSAAVYEKWWRRYNEYADSRSSSRNDVKTFMNWLCTMKQSKEFAPTTIISAGYAAQRKGNGFAWIEATWSLEKYGCLRAICWQHRREKNENQQPSAERRRRIGFIKRRNCHLHELFIREL